MENITTKNLIKESMKGLFIQIEMNSLAIEYFAFKQLSPSDKIPLDKFCEDLNYKGRQDNLDIAGSYISKDFCLNDLSYDDAVYDIFSMVFESILIDDYGDSQSNELGFIIFPPAIQEYINYIFPIFKRIISKSLLLPFYETLVKIPDYKFNSYKKFARIILYNKKRRTSQNFLFNFFSQYRFINKDFNNCFYAQLLKMKGNNELK